MNVKLLSIDPGHCTGWATFGHDDVVPFLIESDALAYTNVEWYNLLTRIHPESIVFERFALYAHKAEQQIHSTFYTVEIIGVTRLYCQQTMTPYTEQTAQVGKAIWKDQYLKAFGFYSPNRHVRDAIRHGLTYLEAHRHPLIRQGWDNVR